MSNLPCPHQLQLFGEAAKRCSICGSDLPLSAFLPRSDRPGQYLAGCRSCRVALNRQQRAAHRKPPAPPPTEKRCTQCARILPVESFPLRRIGSTYRRPECISCKRAAKRAYNEAHREQRAAYSHDYYLQNADACKERIQRSNGAKPDKYRAIHSEWKKRNKDAVNASTHRRRARLSGNRGSWSDEDWQRLKARFDWRCLMCGRQEMADGITLCFDHVVPLAMGGLNVISNGQPLCRSCNSRKHMKAVDFRPDFLASLSLRCELQTKGGESR